MITYLLNDPSTPNLYKNINLPNAQQNPSFIVKGFNPNITPEMYTLEWQSAQVYITLTNIINWYQPITPKKLERFPGTKQLVVHPRAGKDFNAYYDRQNLKFFYNTDKTRNKVIYTCDSVDVVSHEFGHSILDIVRPDLWNSPNLESWAFHESFGDIMAMLNVMQSNDVLEECLKQTNNTLETSNSISKIAEDMGIAIFNITKQNLPCCLRDAVNNLAYVNPQTLSNKKDNKLSAEPHNFSRIFTAVAYDILIGIFKKEIKKSDSLTALQNARNILAYLIAQSVACAPLVPNFYASIAKTMIQIDEKLGSKNTDVLIWAFRRRKILKVVLQAMSNIKIDDLNIKNYEVEETDNSIELRKNTITTMKMCDVCAISQSNNPLMQAEIEVPTQSYMNFNKEGILINEINPSKKQIIDSLKTAVKYIDQNQLYELTNDCKKPFCINENKLLRQFICRHY